MNHIRLLLRNQCGSHIIHRILNHLAFQQNYSCYDGPGESGSFVTLSKPSLMSFLQSYSWLCLIKMWSIDVLCSMRAVAEHHNYCLQALAQGTSVEIICFDHTTFCTRCRESVFQQKKTASHYRGGYMLCKGPYVQKCHPLAHRKALLL